MLSASTQVPIIQKSVVKVVYRVHVSKLDGTVLLLYGFS